MARKRIDEHTLRVLEFDEVRQILASFASSTLGRDAAKALYPSVDASWVNERMSETSELKGLLERGIRIPLAVEGHSRPAHAVRQEKDCV
ncbi:MAG: hypothetical protein ACYSUV_10735 [Planctomycetota bacterium]|jgi:dsDNA-specific endonuclease/ATPase MutS2